MLVRIDSYLRILAFDAEFCSQLHCFQIHFVQFRIWSLTIWVKGFMKQGLLRYCRNLEEEVENNICLSVFCATEHYVSWLIEYLELLQYWACKSTKEDKLRGPLSIIQVDITTVCLNQISFVGMRCAFWGA